ncbi:MAG: DEAD/DEAH box helicase [gamma proteobacterium symbiont of Taylorina sp.]|nr:DEAD/DEAH box helicase [gamma proteobacterium symbiont of Taylorina sp.]
MNRNFSPLFELPNTYRAFYGGFSHLNDIQKQAICPILKAQDLILQSPTGSGKTEAVMAPVIERLIKSQHKYSIIYLVPTKALAIDLKRRMQHSINDKLGLAMGIRTGDIKLAGGDNPDLIITTPESFDVMMGSKNKNLRHFVKRLGTVLIDEAHSLIYNYRGEQLRALLRRLELKTNHPVQKIALSATMGDLQKIALFFRFSANVVKIKSHAQREIIPHLVSLKNLDEVAALLEDLRLHWKYQKILIFVNNRGRCDELLALLDSLDYFKGQVKLHYSNLKTSERHVVEKWFRTAEQAICIATSTLELGIDIGNVDGVVLFEPPDSVAAFLQRIGRANRKKNYVHFWGICQGENAGHQLLRFLAFLSMSFKNTMEIQNPKQLNSVYFQQILSCCYEKQQLSVAAIQALFSALFSKNKVLLSDIFHDMSKKYWLKETKNKGLFSGGKRYYDYLLEYKIWSNFPESAEEYVLELEGESIADLPASLVKQLDVGDTVLLAGKHIRVVLIEDIPYKRVVVLINQQQQDNKEIFWIGRGSHLSYDVAQEIKCLLSRSSARTKLMPGEYNQQLLKGLFRRPAQLFKEIESHYQQSVVLGNKIVVSRTATGFFRYWTFLGGIGNLILQRSIENQLENEDNTFNTSADDTAIDCSQFIDLQKLVLPKTENEFEQWCYHYQSVLQSIFSLNSFARFLPKPLLLQELNSFLYEPRLIKHFIDYQKLSSKIVKGDANFFFVDAQQYSITQKDILDKKIIHLADNTIPLLEREKQRYKNALWKPCLLEKGSNVREKLSKKITATLLANYIRHQQCQRWLVFNYSNPSSCPPKIEIIDREHSLLLEQGVLHEKNCLNFLQTRGNTVISIDADNQTLEQRFEQTQLKLLAISTELNKSNADKVVILDQAVLIHPFCSGDATENSTILDAIGIPDLLRISKTSTAVLWEIGDIKNSRQPRYYQKWQVAFYTFLLGRLKNILIKSKAIDFSIEISTQGLIVIPDVTQSPQPMRSSAAVSANITKQNKAVDNFMLDKNTDNDFEPLMYFFDLKPYSTNFSVLIQQIETVLLSGKSVCHFQLNSHCHSCPWYSYCYRQALTEDIYLYSDLTPGLLQKLLFSGIKTLAQANSFFDELLDHNDESELDKEQQSKKMLVTQSNIFDRTQTQQIKQQLLALKNNCILVKSTSTRLFPDNISAIIFIHSSIEHNTIDQSSADKSHLNNQHDIACFSWQVMELNGQMQETGYWPQNNNSLEDSLNDLWDIWCKLIKHHSGPHFFHYGYQPWDILHYYTRGLAINSLWEKRTHYHTDIQQVLKSHFYFPVPGNLSLVSINYLLNPGNLSFSKMTDFFQSRELLLKPKQIFELYAKIYKQWISQLSSQYRQTQWNSPTENETSGQLFINFIHQEKQLRDADIIDCQQLSLNERITQYRAIGPLVFNAAHLDDEGFFLYVFNMPDRLTKFRKGDFLKLVVIGATDLQAGSPVIIAAIDPHKGELIVKSRQAKLSIKQQLSYSLEEDLTDYTTAKLTHVCEEVFCSKQLYPVNKILKGERILTPESHQPINLPAVVLPISSTANKAVGEFMLDKSDNINRWIKKNQAMMGLNQKQLEALKLPFSSNLSLIEGPPGTGKTHLLGWMLIALFLQAQSQGKPLRIVVSALTHQAIDHVLNKVVELANCYYPDNFPVVCAKWGRSSDLLVYDQQEGDKQFLNKPDSKKQTYQVFAMHDQSDVTSPSHLLLGATGFGCYQLFNAKQAREKNLKGEKSHFPAFFDYVVFDEASQVLIPQALLTLIYAKGNFIFLGDSKQLPPIIKGKYTQTTEHHSLKNTYQQHNNKPLVEQSILDYFVSRSNKDDDVRVTLNTTYRMNQEICEFPSRYFYQQQLLSAVAGKYLKLVNFSKKDDIDEIVDPQKPVALLLLDHQGYHQQCQPEVEKIIKIVQRLVHQYKVACDDIAIIAPHRAQNNAIRLALQQSLALELDQLPLIDTVERIQGAEREVIIFSLTTSDADYIENEFLNNPNRFNVAITRAKTKLIVIASQHFFYNIAHNEEALINNNCFKSFLEYCNSSNCIF